jgi:hypothetical protein
MSLLTRKENTNEYILMSKGADTVMIERMRKSGDKR